MNEYSAFLPGEQAALAEPPKVSAIDGKGTVAGHGGAEQRVAHGENIAGWVLLTTVEINGVMTAVFEKHATHRGAIAYVTERGGTIALIPKQIGDLSKVRPRPTDTPHGVKLERPLRMSPGPDVTGEYILKSSEDPCYENVAALGAEYIGWSLVANEEAGPLGSIYLEADGTEPPAEEESSGRVGAGSGRASLRSDRLFPVRCAGALRISGMATANARCWAAIFRLRTRQCGMRSTAAATS